MEPEVLFENAAGRVARIGDVYVQVRWGVLSIAALDKMAEIIDAARARSPGKLYALFVIEPGADVPTADVRARQKEVLAEIASSGPFFGIVVIEGQGILAHLGRSNMATMSPGTLCIDDVREAAGILANERGTNDAAALVNAVAQVRRRSSVAP